jgi:hypothetical protein
MEYHFKNKYKSKTKGLLELIEKKEENSNVIFTIDYKKEEKCFSGYIDDLPEEVFLNIALELLKNNED